MDGREQPQLADLADGNGERGGDGLFGPVFRGEAFDGAPKVDRGHGRAHDVFAHRPHLVVVVGVFDQDVDFGEAEFDGDADTPGAVDDGEIAVLFGDGRRLEDADGLDAGGQRRVGHVRRAGFCAGCRAFALSDAGIDASQFHLNSPDLSSSRTSSKMKPRRARAIRPGQRRRVAPGSGPPSEAAGRTHPLRRPGVPCFKASLVVPPYSKRSF